MTEKATCRVREIDPAVKAERDAYLDLPSRLSASDERWFPGLASAVEADLSPDHAFYDHSEAAFFVACRGEQVVGRVAVMNNRHFNDYHDSKTAFFTHFECENDAVTACSLFAAAGGWAKSKGLESLAGPIGFLQVDARGMMIEGYSRIQSLAVPYSPPYYRSLMEQAGFSKKLDYLSGELSEDFRISERVHKTATYLLGKTRVSLRNGQSKRHLRPKSAELFEIYHSGGVEAPLYYPISKEEIAMILEGFEKTVCPKLIHYLEYEGRICGFHLATPNYVSVLHGASGGRFRKTLAFLRQRARPKAINISNIYLLPEFQGRGLNLVLFSACELEALKMGCRKALVGPVLEDNTRSLNTIEKTGVRFDIRHRVFEKTL